MGSESTHSTQEGGEGIHIARMIMSLATMLLFWLDAARV